MNAGQTLSHEDYLRGLDEERASLLSRLKALIAHEINNPLAVVVHCIESLTTEAYAQTRSSTYLERATLACDRIRSLVADFAQVAAVDCDLANVNSLREMVRLSCRMLAARSCGDVWLENRVEESVFVLAHKARMTQALFALASHLLDLAESSGGGGVRFSTDRAGLLSMELVQVQGVAAPRIGIEPPEVTLARRYFSLLGCPFRESEGGFEISLTLVHGGDDRYEQ